MNVSQPSNSIVNGQKAGTPHASCTCGHLGRFRLDRASSSSSGSARCEICGGWQSMSTIRCYAALKKRGERRSFGRFFALGALVLVGLVATTLVGAALDYRGSSVES